MWNIQKSYFKVTHMNKSYKCHFLSVDSISHLPILMISSRDAPFHILVERAAPHIECDLNWDVFIPALFMENLTQFAPFYILVERAAPHIECDLNWDVFIPALSM